MRFAGFFPMLVRSCPLLHVPAMCACGAQRRLVTSMWGARFTIAIKSEDDDEPEVPAAGEEQDQGHKSTLLQHTRPQAPTPAPLQRPLWSFRWLSITPASNPVTMGQ